MRPINRTTAVVLIATGFALALLAQSANSFKARLSPLPADARTRSVITGIGSATATLEGSKLTVSGTFEGLHSPAAAAELRESSITGIRGKPLSDLMVTKAPSGTVNGSVELTSEQVASYKKGDLYVQIDTEKEPKGDLWGWLLP